MVVARKYQFSDLVKRIFFTLLGALAIRMTSLNETICTAVTMAMI